MAYDPPATWCARSFFARPDGSDGSRVLLRASSFAFDEADRQFQVDADLFVPAGTKLTTVPPPVDGALTPGDGKLTTRLEFDAIGRQAFSVEDDGAVTRFEYDGAGRCVREVLPQDPQGTTGGPEAVLQQFDANNNVTRRTETFAEPIPEFPHSKLESVFVYDALDRMVRATDPEGHTEFFEYDSRDNLVTAYDARGPMVPDPLDLHPDGPSTDMETQRGSPMMRSTDAGWKPVNSPSPPKATDPSTPQTHTIPMAWCGLLTEYDANGRVVRRVDDNGHATTYGYDALDRLLSQDNADGGRRVHSYDADGHPTRLVDENGTVHQFSHDALGRVTACTVAADPAKRIAAGTLPLLVGTTQQLFT